MRSSLFPIVVCLVLVACKKDEAAPPPGQPTPPTGVAAVSFSALNFTGTNAYFSTTSGMQQPVNASAAQSLAGQIDITYTYEGTYWQPGFLAPLTRSREWYWNQYHAPWLSVADSTQVFGTNITAAQFNSARSNSSLIGTYFNTAGLVYLAPHTIFPIGTCVGGRETINPSNVLLQREMVVGFKNHVTGKRGLIFIRNDQNQYWPDNITTNATKVDIIREP